MQGPSAEGVCGGVVVAMLAEGVGRWTAPRHRAESHDLALPVAPPGPVTDLGFEAARGTHRIGRRR